jgi:hypothetical protein
MLSLFLIIVALLLRYIQLLSKYRPEQRDATPLSSTFALLCAKTPAADTVVALVMDMVDCLLSSEDMETPSNAAPILVDHVASEAMDSSMILVLFCTRCY